MRKDCLEINKCLDRYNRLHGANIFVFLKHVREAKQVKFVAVPRDPRSSYPNEVDDNPLRNQLPKVSS